MRQVLNIAYYEILHILKDPILFLIVFIAPLFYAVLFGLVYINGVLENIPMAIIDLDKSSLSREIVTAFGNDSNFNLIDGIDTYDDLEKAMQEDKIRAGIVIPEHYAQDMLLHQKPEILSVYDGSNLVWGYNIRKNVRPVIDHINDQYVSNYLAQLGFTQKEIEAVMQSVDGYTVTWYNPTYSYNNFLFLGLMMMVIHQIGLLSAGLTVTREKENNTWLQYTSSGIEKWKIVLGKCLPYLMASFFNYSLLLWISVQFVQVKVGGNPLLLMLIGLLFTSVITFAGFIISLYCVNSLQATRYIMLLSIPLFIISGFTWPVTHIPALINGLAKLLPYTWMADGIRMITIKNASIADISVNLLVLLAMMIIVVYLALKFHHKDRLILGGALAINNDPSYPRKHRL